MRVRFLAAIIALAALPLASVWADPVDPAPFDCEGQAPDAEPGTEAWALRDATNMYCAEQRHHDKALHPVTPRPNPGSTNDAYREPSRHAGVRFRFDTTMIDGRATEVYRPLPDVEPPYPAVVSIHGGASNKGLHWWSSQPLAESGYLVVSFDSASTIPSSSDVEDVLAWLFDDDNPFAADIDRDRVGLAGHSTGGALASRFGQLDPRLRASVEWDRGPNMPLPETLDTPALFITGDYGCQLVPLCQPEPRMQPPADPVHGPWASRGTGPDFERMRDAGTDTMKISIRAALHLDWVPSELSGNRYVELVSMYYTIAWFDRYLNGDADAFDRLTADTFDASADVHNISQGLWDPVKAATSGDPLYGGNVPYAVAGMPVADRLSYSFYSRCFITDPRTGDRRSSDDMRRDGCGAA